MKGFAWAAAASLVALCFTTATYAADDHPSHAQGARATQAHAHESRAQHGGVVSVVKDMSYELVAKDGEVALQLKGQPKSSARFTLP